MNDYVKIFAGAVAGGVLTLGGAHTFGGVDVAQPVSEQKNTILKQYVQAQARLGEVPTLDLSIVSNEEMSQAIADIANEQQIVTKDNIFEALHEKAVAEGTACK